MTPKFEKLGSTEVTFDDFSADWHDAGNDWSEQLAFDHYVEPAATIRGFDWAREITFFKPNFDVAGTDAYIQCQVHGLRSLHETVEIISDVRGGIPVLKGTRFTISQLVAELSETTGPAELAENFDLDEEQIKTFLNGLALLMHKSYTK